MSVLRRLSDWWHSLWTRPPIPRDTEGHYISEDGQPYSVNAEPVGGAQNAVRVTLYHAYEPVIPNTRIPGLEAITDANASAIDLTVRRLLAEADTLSARYTEALVGYEPPPKLPHEGGITEDDRDALAEAVVERLTRATRVAEE